jgi:hypothetical protein
MADQDDDTTGGGTAGRASGEVAQPSDGDDAGGSPDVVAAVAALSADQYQALLAARDQLEQQVLPALDTAAAAAGSGDSGGGTNVVGVAIGIKATDGSAAGALALKVFVKQTLDPANLDGQAAIPDSVGDFPVDVEETGEIVPQQAPTDRVRPAPGGVSIGHCNFSATAGTLGCLVSDGALTYVLSNNHVLAMINQGPVGAGHPQPGRSDGGTCAADVIAQLSLWVKLDFTGANLVDCAIAQVSDPSQVDARIRRGNGNLDTIVMPVVPPSLGLDVQKSGRSTGDTQGKIDAVDATIDVNYGGLVARFRRQFRVSGNPGPFNTSGDSGALVTTAAGNQPVGLLFAGNSHTVSFCNPIQSVLDALVVTLVTS